MSVPFRLPPVTGVLLLLATSLGWAETPLPDPVAPAVLGRPLAQIKPVRPARKKPALAKADRPLQLAATPALGAAPALAAAPAPAVPQALPVAQQAPKQALDDRFDPNARIVDNVGKGTHLATKPLGAGAYFSSRMQAMVRQYYQAHPGPAKAGAWQIGEPVPKKAAMTGVPDEVRAALPRVPPGLQYVELDGEVVLVAVQSRMVVDGISRSVR